MRFLSIPAIALAIALAIGFFKVYGYFTRPEVPLAVSTVVSQFAPGVQIGGKVDDMRRAVAGLTWVRHVGWVGLPAKREGGNMPDGNVIEFAQVRLLADERTRGEAGPDQTKSRVDAVEIVTGQPGAYNDILTALMMVFRAQPREGCVRVSESDRLREVHYFITHSGRGGVALITPHGSASDTTRSRVSATPGLTEVLAFTGPFQGGRTLRASYEDRTCAAIAGEE